MSYDVLQPGLFNEAGPPMFGSQDVGISPGGCMDRLAFETGRILLGRHQGIVTLEVILPPVIRLTQSSTVVLTGAHFPDCRLLLPDGAEAMPVRHGETVAAPSGSVLEMGEKVLGFRGYVSLLPADGLEGGASLAGRIRGRFDDVFSWPDPEGLVRVVRGPEHGTLDRGDLFTAVSWKTTHEMSTMGMRLANDSVTLSTSLENMISAPVSDGTIQLTPKGPIILLRHRQTVGGYPRIYNVISADVDVLAQIGPEQVLRFKEISMDEAMVVAKTRKKELDTLASRFNPAP
jgi:allophanate hydrolase subunit 2